MKSIPPSRFAARVSSLLVAAGLLIAAPAAAYGQCAPGQDTAQALEQAQAVFVANVLSVDQSGRVAQMEVLSVWKGRELSNRVEVRGASSGDAPAAGTDGRFTEGATYLVVPENGREPFLATSCSATQPYPSPPNLIPPIYQDAVGADTGRNPVSAPALTPEQEEAQLATSIVPLLGLIALIALALVALAWVRSTQPEQIAQAADPEPAKKEQRPKKVKRRNFKRDTAGAEQATSRTLRRNNRGFKWYRRRQDRQVAAARKARGSTDTS